MNSGSSTKLNSPPTRRPFDGDYKKSEAKHSTVREAGLNIIALDVLVAFHCLQAPPFTLTHTQEHQQAVNFNQTFCNQ